MRVAIDTSVLVGLLNPTDTWHRQANELLMDQFAQDYTWILSDAQRLFPDVLALMQSSSGSLNFNDGLIALSCRERAITAIASFDADFDQLPWLQRMSRAVDISKHY